MLSTHLPRSEFEEGIQQGSIPSIGMHSNTNLRRLWDFSIGFCSRFM